MILVSVDAGGQPGDQELEDHGLTSGLKIPTSWLDSVYAQPEIFQLGRGGRLFIPYGYLLFDVGVLLLVGSVGLRSQWPLGALDTVPILGHLTPGLPWPQD